jgi:RDD family protein
MMIAWFGIMVMYPVVFEAMWNGATPGKRVCNLAVVHGDGTPIGWTAAFVRNVVRFADVLPFGYAAGLTTMMLDGQFRRLGDLAAGTIVIHRESLAATARTAMAKAETAKAVPAHVPFALTPLEQRAVLDFAERRRTWSTERAAELAEVAAPLVEGRHGDAAVARIVSIASGLVHKR